MTLETKKAIRDLVLLAIETLGTQTAVANKCDCSAATINQIVKEQYEQVKVPMWNQIAAKLEYAPGDWQYVDTYDIQLVHSVFDDAKCRSMWFAISSPAGSQKSTAIETYDHRDMFHVECKEWTRKRFLTMLATQMGIATSEKMAWYNIQDLIVGYIHQRSSRKLLLVVDQADRLKDDAMFVFIDLYNDLRGKLGVVFMGTEHLQRRIKTGVAWNKQGFDELESRFGRTYIHLTGLSKPEFTEIFKSNGISDEATINRSWNDCIPVKSERGGKPFNAVKDLRRMEKIIRREQLTLADTKKQAPASVGGIM